MTTDQRQPELARAMRDVVELLRAEPTPEIDWERSERELRRRIAGEAARRRVHQPRWQRSTFVAVSAFAAAAALLALMARVPEPTELPSVAESGAVLSAAELPHSFTLGKLAECTLLPHSRALLRCGEPADGSPCSEAATPSVRVDRGGLRADHDVPKSPYVIVLEKGSVSANVAPASGAAPLEERLIVEAGGVRVAVHGTRFSVERGERDVTVEVTRGAVTVGPAGHRGMTTGHLLVAPARAAFSIDGARLARLLAPSAGRQPLAAVAAASPPTADDEPVPPAEPDRAAQAEPDEGPAAGPSAIARHTGRAPPEPTGRAAGGSAREDVPAEPDEPDEPTTPTGGELPLRLAAARANMVGCLSGSVAATAREGEVRVTISSKVRLTLDDRRRIVSVRFSPPLKPELQQRCAGTVLGRRLANEDSTTEFFVEFSPR